ncbi:hypothetical protein KW786_01845 [Candidatus Parcubacteria bacterium]|nr:hypothetical protein [Candidatus Parcubacteria bacterium]
MSIKEQSGAETNALATDKERTFKEQEAVMTKIYKDGFPAYVESLGISVDPREYQDNIYTAGSGILLSEKEFDDMIEEVKRNHNVEELKNSGLCFMCMDERTKAEPGVFTSHEGCGAVGIWVGTPEGAAYCEKNSLDPNDVDAVAKHWSKARAEKLGMKYKHLEVDKPDYHYGRAFYYLVINQFNYKALKGLPPGFTVSRKSFHSRSSRKQQRRS